MTRLLLALLLLGTVACAPEPPQPPAVPETPPAGAPSTAVPLTDCPSTGWCWVRGRPLTVGGEAGRVHAIGSEGSFLRWTADGWVSHRVPTTRTLTSALIASDGALWASDEAGSAWHHDGARWAEAPAGTPILRLLGEAQGAVWALEAGAGGAHGTVAGGAVLRRDGAAWTRAIEPHAWCMGGDVALVGEEVWSTGLACSAPGTLSGAEVRRFDGDGWALIGAPIVGQAWYPRFERVEGRVMVRILGMFDWDGAAWVSYALPEYPQGLAVDEAGLWDGYDQVVVPRWQCTAIHRVDSTQAWCSGRGQIYVADEGGAWRPTLADPYAETQGASAAGHLPPALWAGSDTTVAWRGGPTQALRGRVRTAERLEVFDGRTWTERTEQLRDVHGSGPDDAWLVTDQGVLHFDGRSFTPVAIPDTVTRSPVIRVHALAPGRVLLLTEAELIAYDGTTFAVLHRPSPGAVLLDVAGSSADDLWVTGVRWSRPLEGSLAHFDGTTWTETALGDTLAEVLTAGRASWLVGDGIRRLDASEPVLAPPAGAGGVLWADADAVWLTTHDQALRWPRP